MNKSLLLVLLFVLASCNTGKNYPGAEPGFGGQSILISSGSSSGQSILKKEEYTNTLKLHDFMALSGQNSFLGEWDAVQLVENLEVSYGEKKLELTLYGHTNKGQRAWGYQLLSGSFFTEADLEMKTDVIILGEKVAHELFEDESPMGKMVLVENTPYEVSGVVIDGHKNIFGDKPGEIAMVPISNLLRKLFKSTYLRAGKLELLNQDDMVAKLEILRSSLRDRHHLKSDESDDFTFQVYLGG